MKKLLRNFEDYSLCMINDKEELRKLSEFVLLLPFLLKYVKNQMCLKVLVFGMVLQQINVHKTTIHPN
jgi:hypothetical protein